MRYLRKRDLSYNVVVIPLSKTLNMSKFHQIGYNYGIFGWNWSAYRKDNDQTIYVQGCRNLPWFKSILTIFRKS